MTCLFIRTSIIVDVLSIYIKLSVINFSKVTLVFLPSITFTCNFRKSIH